MTREKAMQLVSSSSAMVLRVNEDVSGILILAYSHYFQAAVEYYFSKRNDCILQQILSPIEVHEATKMRIVETHLEYDC